MIVEKGKPTEAQKKEFEEEVRDIFGKNVELTIDYVGEIPTPPSGKNRIAISKMSVRL